MKGQYFMYSLVNLKLIKNLTTYIQIFMNTRVAETGKGETSQNI